MKGGFFLKLSSSWQMKFEQRYIKEKGKALECGCPEVVSKDEGADILPQAEYIPDPRDHKDDPPPSMSGVKKFFLVLLALLVVCVATRGCGDDDLS
jgi:hypothetical protein